MKPSDHPAFLRQNSLPALIVRQDGSILAANQPAAALFGYAVDEFSSLTIGDLIAPDHRPLFQQAVRELAEQAAVEHEMVMVDREQRWLFLSVRISRLEEDLLAFEIFGADAVKEMPAIYRRQTAILRAVADASHRIFRSPRPEEVIPALLAELGTAADVSRAYLFENHSEDGGRLLTSQRYEWCAEGVASFIDDPTLQDFDYLAAGFDHFLQTLQAGEVFAGNVSDFPPAEQAEFSRQGILSILIIPIFVQNSFWGFIGFDECRREREWNTFEVDALRTAANLLGAFYERRKAETALRASEELYRMLVENQGLGVILVDEDENVLFANAETDKLFGVNEGGLIGRNLREFLAPQQMQVVLEQTSLRRKGYRSQYEIEIGLAPHQRRIVTVHATPHFDEQGQYLGAFGVFNDVTEQKRMEQRIRSLLVIEQAHRRQSESLRDAFGALIHDLSSKQAAKQVLNGLARIVPYDRCALYLEENGKFRLAAKTGYLTGRPPASLTENHEVWPEKITAKSRVWFLNHIQDSRQLELLGETTPGVSWMVIPLKWNNRPIGLLWLIRAPATAFKSSETPLAETFAGPAALSIQNSRLFTQARRLATIDGLTGLLNRRSIFEAGERELTRAQRYEEPFSLLVIDLDNFKEVNDRHGHLKGDGLLKRVARRMKSVLRRNDFIGRPGGDEFIVLLGRTTAAEAVVIAGRLLKAVSERPYRINGTPYKITASIGVASKDEPTTTLQTLIHRADAVMYTAKQNGGNRVEVG
ncbi:MAG: diguanylate cyclase [Chloroflexota bacterium]